MVVDRLGDLLSHLVDGQTGAERLQVRLSVCGRHLRHAVAKTTRRRRLVQLTVQTCKTSRRVSILRMTVYLVAKSLPRC